MECSQRKLPDKADAALSDLRVLDLVGPMGSYCTKLLADLGADVIKVERPGGDPARSMGPFVGNVPHVERSIYFFHYNTNKRSITLNIETADGRDIFKRLIKSVDIMVETFPVGYLDQLGLGYPVLSEINPRLILTSITGFGQTGPYKDFKASDIVGVATGGMMYLSGFPSDAPHRAGGSQGYHMASSNAAVGTLIALYYRDITGKGQHVDISMQGAVLRASETAIPAYAFAKKIRKRTGAEIYRGIRDLFPCKDGHILCSPLGGSGADKMLVWMESEGMAADLKDEKYQELFQIIGARRPTGGMPKKRPTVEARRLSELSEQMAHLEEVWEAFLKTHTKEELYERAQAMGVRLMPVNSAKDLLEDPHLKARDFFTDVEHPELGTTFKYPGPPYRLSRTPWRIAKRAPLIGEHNLEIYEGELGFTKEQLSTLKTAGAI